ncbi:hypothetical protein MYP_2504 [Sporocytophaga myxococcoides]|uniref:Uncharacterized protein n=1 Tax=Sporocytophaga myxococcoides TaxID=153721 RepID=A0A098LED5_9BACT|nr:hypothetical protein [Sporocytophaga myxococcoides]GAL85275.1 hypothetical protein MYP_2504 [Sporocytophaga myxococcoides]
MERKELVMVFWNDLKLSFEQLEAIIKLLKPVVSEIFVFSKTEEGRLAAQCLCHGSYVQFGDTFPEKVHNAFLKAYMKNFDNTIFIDYTEVSLTLNPRIIREAFSFLEEKKLVVGRNEVNRMVLLGMAGFLPHVFEEKFYFEILGEPILEEGSFKKKNIVELGIFPDKRTSFVYSFKK